MQVSFGEICVMSSCVKPLVQSNTSPVVLLHGFDRSFRKILFFFFGFLLLNICVFEVHCLLLFSSCLEWRYTYPLLEEAGLETWAVDILGWGFSDLGLLLSLFETKNFVFL